MLAVASTHTCGFQRFHTLRCAATGLRSTYSGGSDTLKRRSKKSKPRQREVRATASALPGLQTPLGPIVAQDYVTAVAAAGAAYVWVRLFDWMASRGLLGQNLSRKLVHISSGPLFVLTWPFFRLALVGAGIVDSPNTVKAVSRTDDRTELLRGPLFYVIIMTATTMIFWRQSPVGMMVISLMCGGDGLADIIGRKFGSAKLPFNRSKSWAGSFAMFAGGAAMSTAFVALFTTLGFFPGNAQTMLPAILATSLAAAVVESLPVNQVVDDNFSVPAVAAVMGHFMMQSLL